MRFHASLAKLGATGLLAVGLTALPITLSPDAGIERKGACASDINCKFEPGSMCTDPLTGETADDYYKTVVE